MHMRVLVIGINYAPEKTSVAPFTTGVCEHLASKGHQVETITAFPYYPEWRVWHGYRGRAYLKERINNVSVHRVWHFVPRRASNLVQRLAHDFSLRSVLSWLGYSSASSTWTTVAVRPRHWGSRRMCSQRSVGSRSLSSSLISRLTRRWQRES